MSEFVTVRAVQAWGLDLSLFQFDGELTMAVMFLNADKTIYGRYGSRADKKSSRFYTTAGLVKAMEGALELHRDVASVKKSLEGKKGKSPVWKTPEQLPALKGRPNIKPADGSRGGCVHCHQAGDGEAWSTRMAKKKVGDDLVWAYPMPDAVGLSLDPDERATVKSVAAGSAAQKAGFKDGDRIMKMVGQPIISIADVQWVLHNAEAPCSIDVEVRRGEATETLKVALAADWRRSQDFTWRVIVWSMRHRLVGTEPLSAADDAEKRTLGVAAGDMAIKVKGLPPSWVKEKAQSGFKPGDVIVQVDKRKDLVTESQMLAYLFQEVPLGGAATFAVLRGGKREQVVVKMQW
jgi:hypothetical protein